MANIASAPLGNNRPSTPCQQGNSTSSIRLLAGSHMSSSTNGATVSSATSAVTNAVSVVAGLNGTSSSSTSPNQQLASNQAFFQANPHLLNSAALHSTHHNLQVSSQYMTPQYVQNGTIHHVNGVFKEPQSMQHDKRSNTRILHETCTNNKDHLMQVSTFFKERLFSLTFKLLFFCLLIDFRKY